MRRLRSFSLLLSVGTGFLFYNDSLSLRSSNADVIAFNGFLLDAGTLFGVFCIGVINLVVSFIPDQSSKPPDDNSCESC